MALRFIYFFVPTDGRSVGDDEASGNDGEAKQAERAGTRVCIPRELAAIQNFLRAGRKE